MKRWERKREKGNKWKEGEVPFRAPCGIGCCQASHPFMREAQNGFKSGLDQLLWYAYTVCGFCLCRTACKLTKIFLLLSNCKVIPQGIPYMAHFLCLFLFVLLNHLSSSCSCTVRLVVDISLVMIIPGDPKKLE